MRMGQRVKEAFERWYKKNQQNVDFHDDKGVFAIAYAAGWFAATRFHKAEANKHYAKEFADLFRESRDRIEEKRQG